MSSDQRSEIHCQMICVIFIQLLTEYFSAGLENTSIHWTSRSVSALGVFYVTALYRSTFSYLLTYSATFHSLYCALAPPVIVIDWSGQRSEEDLRIYTRSR